MFAEDLDRQIGDLAASLGDTTRRGIFLTVREAPQPMTASEIAALFEIHPNVARHHLDRLVRDGYLQVSHRRPPGKTGPGAGRPAKHYEPTDKAINVQFPPRRLDLLVDLLIRFVERIAPDDAPEIAEAVGREYGRELAAELDLAGEEGEEGYEIAAAAVAKALTGVGFDTEVGPDGSQLVTRFCPFGEAARARPDIICRMDQGIVRGLLEAGRRHPVAIVTPHAGDESCVTDL